MLETIKTLLQEPEQDFAVFYQEYINSVQDDNINKEVMHLQITSQGDKHSVLRCLNDIQRGLNNEFFERS